jgi:tryptophan-rich hypothetical protein
MLLWRAAMMALDHYRPKPAWAPSCRAASTRAGTTSRWLYKGRPPRAETAASVTLSRMNRLHPKKLLLTKWTAVHPAAREKHFLVSKVILPELRDAKIEWVELEAVRSRAVRRIAWRELRDDTQWRQGWR